MPKNLLLFTFIFFFSISAFSARPIDLDHSEKQMWKIFHSKIRANKGNDSDLTITRQERDFNRTLHVRIKQTHKGYPVWGGEAIVHVPNGLRVMDTRSLIAKNDISQASGLVYMDLDKDLNLYSRNVFTKVQGEKALIFAINDYMAQGGYKGEKNNKSSDLVIFVDKENKAHYAYHVSFYVKPPANRPEFPNYLLDADTFKIYKQWDDVKTFQFEKVVAGGFGGNQKIGRIIYDGNKGDLNLPTLKISRDPENKICYLQNDQVTVSDYREGENVISSFSCQKEDNEHHLYWDGDRDQINGAYSPNHDALYAGMMINELYFNWYNLYPLERNKKPMVLNMVTHSPNIRRGEADPDNAYWDSSSEKMYFGDGANIFYPLTSLGIAAHEISHGFTEQHSHLAYYDESGGMNEAFSDMAAKAAEYYVSGKSDIWTIGTEVIKSTKIEALRYMDQPSKDCVWLHQFGIKECSIDHMNEYKENMNVHHSSGLYNRVFYLIATSPDWNTRKAFDVMVKANSHYWTSTVSFASGACGVLKATKDYGYDKEAVVKAFLAVGIDTKRC